MNYADEIRRQVEAAPRAALPAVTAALWRAYSEGKVTEAEAESLSGLIEARRATAPIRGTRFSFTDNALGKNSAENPSNRGTGRGHNLSGTRP